MGCEALHFMRCERESLWGEMELCICHSLLHTKQSIDSLYVFGSAQLTLLSLCAIQQTESFNRLTVSTFGYIPSVWFILADVSEPDRGSIFKGFKP
jgi:hypothetical protein